VPGEFYDALETRDPGERERDLFARLPGQLQLAKDKCPAYAEILGDVDPATITDRAALATLPVTRKSQLPARQNRRPPLGGMNVCPPAQALRIHASPGPIYELETARPDYWRMARALFAAGVRRGELVHNSFAYHFSPAGFMLESAARALGCPVFPAGPGQTELQARAIAQLKPAVYVGTPSFLKIIFDKSAELRLPAPAVTKALVSGEALPPALRADLAGRGVTVAQCYAIADLGLIAYESPAREGMIVDEEVIVEIVTPGGGVPVAEGEAGEVVVTVLNPDYPLLRLATGDLSAFLPGPSPCGRTNARIKGWLGRADQSAKVRGMFVRPEMVAEILRRHPQIKKARLTITAENMRDDMTLRCETSATESESLAQAITRTVREVCKLRATVELLPPGRLPADGKVIDDTRPAA